MVGTQFLIFHLSSSDSNKYTILRLFSQILIFNAIIVILLHVFRFKIIFSMARIFNCDDISQCTLFRRNLNCTIALYGAQGSFVTLNTARLILITHILLLNSVYKSLITENT